MPKCASTWLQQQLFKPCNGYQPRYRPVESQLVFVDPPEGTWRAPEKLLGLKRAGGRVPTISGEMLAGNPLTGGADRDRIRSRIHRALPKAKILIIICEQSDMFRSLYKLLVNWGYGLSPQELLADSDRSATDRFNLSYLCYDSLIRSYQQTFGEDQVLVLPYELFTRSAERFITTVNQFAESPITEATVDTDKVLNADRSSLGLELKRLCNRYIASTEFSPLGFYRPAAIHKSFNFSPPCPASLQRKLQERFRGEFTDEIRQICGPSNSATNRLTGLDLASFGYSVC